MGHRGGEYKPGEDTGPVAESGPPERARSRALSHQRRHFDLGKNTHTHPFLLEGDSKPERTCSPAMYANARFGRKPAHEIPGFRKED
jgi:hypothetical protein